MLRPVAIEVPEPFPLPQDPWFAEFLFCCLTVWPLARIVARAGRHPAWAALVFVPMVGLVALAALLWVSHWPLLPPRPAQPPRKARRTA